MFVELIESLRCPRSHEESALVASATRTDDRHIVEGLLGCPVCGVEFCVANGVAYFDEPVEPTPLERSDPETGMRLAAFLELTDRRGFAVLCGRWSAHVDYVLRLTDTPLVLLNPPSDVAVDSVAGAVIARHVCPFAPRSARAAALDALGDDRLMESVSRAVRPGGRVLGPTSLRVTTDVTEIARDERIWVGEKNAAPNPAPHPVPIKRAR